jgi:PAS domain S-box-containing protein
MRIFAAFIALVTLLLGVFFVYEYFAGRGVLIASDPNYAVTSAQELLSMLLKLGIAVSILVAALIYSVLMTRDNAKRMAYVLSRDMANSKEQFRKFYDLSPVPYLLIDPHGIIDRPNKASLRFFGVPEEGLRGKNFFSFLNIPEHPDKLALYRERVSHHVPLEQVEVQVTKSEGVAHWALLSVEDLSSPSESKHQGLVTFVDINDQKELERMKTEFLSLASHQLRAPLANLKWYIDFLLTRRAEALSEDVVSYLHKMYRRNEDMIELVNTLLNLSRIEMGRVKVDSEHVDLADITRSVTEELEPTAKEKEIIVDAELAEKFPFETDGKLVRIIAQNLLSNALRYTPKGGHVTVRLSDSGGRGAILEVTDTGIGIPPEEQEHIFSKLYRAANAKQMEVNGNGIGLYMCKALAEGMGGTIEFTSTVGKGTTFTLKLP